MPKIVITEQDLTKPGVVSESTDVVYIPGFVDVTQEDLYDIPFKKDSEGNIVIDPDTKKAVKDEDKDNWVYIGLEVNKPHLFKSVAEFTSLVGPKAVTFAEDQKFSELPASFASAAVPAEDIMIKAGSPDPAYVLAKELLSAGMLVMFERVNAGSITQSNPVTNVKIANEDAEKITLKELLESGKYSYQVGDGPIIAYNSSEAIDAIPSKPNFTEANVYTIQSVSTQPTDWAQTFGSYYEEKDGQFKPLTSAPTFVADKFFTLSVITKLTTAQESAWNTTFANFAYADKEEPTDIFRYALGQHLPSIAGTITYKNIYELSAANMYSKLPTIFSTEDGIVSGIIDKGNYSIKYLTSGGYPTFEYDSGSIVTAMLAFAEKRGDCVALIDHTDCLDRSINPFEQGSLYKEVQEQADDLFDANGDFGAMFTPWATYNRTTSETYLSADGKKKLVQNDAQFRAPGSFAYLTSLADSIKTNANWLAIAGAARGGVRNLAAGGMTTVIPNGVADTMQPRDDIAVNAITNIAPYGHTIWGNRTLKNNAENLVATSFLNIRNLVSDVKKTCYRTARSCTFEQDTDLLWVNFKNEIAKLLDRMKSGYGISGYKIVRNYEHEKAAEKATICAQIILYPTYAVEDFYIDIILKDDEVSVN